MTSSNNNERIGLIGDGPQADEAQSFAPSREISFRAVDKEYADDRNMTVDIDNPGDGHKDTAIVAAVGAPAIRRMMIEKWPGDKFGTIISEHAVVDRTSKIGEGTIVAPRTVITTNVMIGKHNIINIGSTISHDCIFGDFVTISPGAHIGGRVILGDGVFVGIGSTIKNDIRVAPGVVIGAGAVVVKNITEENSVYAGVPAKQISKNDGWLSEV